MDSDSNFTHPDKSTGVDGQTSKGMTYKDLARNWQTIAFCVAITLFATSFVFFVPASDGYLCSADDKVIAVCLRNWSNSAGSLLTGMVAFAAAFFAFRQWKASDKQVSAAILPSLEERLRNISRLNEATAQVGASFYDFAARLGSFRIAAAEGEQLGTLNRIALDIKNLSERLSAGRKNLYGFFVDITIDDDIIRAAKEVHELSNLETHELIVRAMNLLGYIERRYDRGNDQAVLERVRGDARAIEAAVEQLGQVYREILTARHKFIFMAEAAKRKRLAALALDQPSTSI